MHFFTYLKTIFKKELAFAKEIELNDTSFDFAIKLEEAGKYEEAAKIRDQIKELEQ